MPFSRRRSNRGLSKRSIIPSNTEKGASRNIETMNELLKSLGWKFYKAGDRFSRDPSDTDRIVVSMISWWRTKASTERA